MQTQRHPSSQNLSIHLEVYNTTMLHPGMHRAKRCRWHHLFNTLRLTEQGHAPYPQRSASLLATLSGGVYQRSKGAEHLLSVFCSKDLVKNKSLASHGQKTAILSTKARTSLTASKGRWMQPEHDQTNNDLALLHQTDNDLTHRQ